MAAKLWDATAEAFVDAGHRLYSTELEAYVEAGGRKYDETEEVWVDVFYGSGANLAVGSIYTLGGTAHTSGELVPSAKCLDIDGNLALMQTYGLLAVAWPGQEELSELTAEYFGNLMPAIKYVYLMRIYNNGKRQWAEIYWGDTWFEDTSYGLMSLLNQAAANWQKLNAQTYTNSVSYSLAYAGNNDDGGYIAYTGSASTRYAEYTRKLVCAPFFVIDMRKIKLDNETTITR